MALVRAIEKIPGVPGKTRRGLLVALEGPTECRINELFDKILPELEGNMRGESINSLDFHWKIPEADYRNATARLFEIQESIIKSLNQGQLVVVHNHMLSVLASAYRHNVMHCKEVQDVAGARLLLSVMRGIIIPDITFLMMPGIETSVNRLVKTGALENEDDYMYSEYRQEALAYNKMASFVDGVYDLSSNPIGTEGEMLQRIILTSVTDCYNPIKFYFA